MVTILSIIGARPQLIKASVLSQELSKNKKFKEVVIHTGQHYDENMSDIFFRELNIPYPRYTLAINQGTHAEQTGRMMMEIEKIALKENPAFVLVYGDTNSTLAGALAGAKLSLPVAHVEAGMRSFDKKMPEEINRVITDHCSSLFFCASKTAIENLKKESITQNVFEVGDVMYDSIILFSRIAKKESTILKRWDLKPREYVTLTIHRVSNADNKDNLTSILNAFIRSKLKVIFPVHPRTRKRMGEYGIWEKYQNKNIFFMDPVSYLDMISLQENSRIMATDSGGIQKEAYYLGIPCLTLRDVTEWTETIINGGNVLVSANETKILDALQNPPKGVFKEKIYGDGKACQKIVTILEHLYT